MSPRRLSFWSTSIAGQLTVLLLVALVVSHALVTAFLLNQRSLQAEEANRRMIVLRTQSILALIATIPDELHAMVTRAASDARVHFRLERAPAVEASANGRLARRLLRRLSSDLTANEVGIGPAAQPLDVRVAFLSGNTRQPRSWLAGPRSETQQSLHGPHRFMPRHRHAMADGPSDIVALSVQVAEGQWLNVTAALTPPLQWASPIAASVMVMAVMIIAIAILMARRLVRPLRALSKAAEAFGRGDRQGPLAEEGPSDIRQTTKAFNEMQDRLTRFIADRTRLLAAVGHDLRTPITSLRLRAEFVEDEENRDRIIATLDEMAAMVEATLSFARDDAAREGAEIIDLAASLRALTTDYADLGKAVHYEGPADLSVRCKPLSLRRAVRNLVDNALSYGGGEIVVALVPEADRIAIEVRDEGPGIDPGQLEAVFEPFMRLESSRNRATGGVGLGLSIARSVARAGGGDLTLVNRHSAGGESVGLTARLSLPRAA